MCFEETKDGNEHFFLIGHFVVIGRTLRLNKSLVKKYGYSTSNIGVPCGFDNDGQNETSRIEFVLL